MNQRQKELLQHINDKRKVAIADEAEFFKVSEMTIRRDLRYLESRDLIITTKGGAIAPPSIGENKKEAVDNKTKRLIAEELLKTIKPGLTIMLSTGTTVLEFAKVLAERNLYITIITNSIPAASAFFQTNSRVILIGGELRGESLDLVGPAAEKYLADYHIDLLVAGCDGADTEAGFYTSDLNLANLEKLSARQSDKTVIITESEKFQKKSLVVFTEIESVDAVITDNGISKKDKKALEKGGVEVTIVKN
ncbi:MAG: DeoR/GlpR family DNA-binding transcription regulator [Planctomycetota bacterium]